MRKNVYFVQADITADIKGKNAYLPYTAGVLVASAFRSQIVNETCCFKEFIFYRENIKAIISRLDNPAFMGFCCYSWNSEYNKRLAKEVKEKFPHCLIVFGGHDIADNFDLLEEFDFIDVLCHGEGEETIRKLMEAFALNAPFDDVANISFRKGVKQYVRTFSVAQQTLDYPSPYLDGWFDELISNHPDTEFDAVLETTRGCAYRCAYCDWSDSKTKIRLAPLEKVIKEIQWMSDHKIVYVWSADANFGADERDIEIVNELVRLKTTTGYPEKLRFNYAKNNFEVVFDIVKKLKACDMDRFGATLALQSLSPEVLKNIGRTNASLDFYRDLVAVYRAENMKCYSELILGLPGETYKSFIKGLATIFEIGQHFLFDVYSCIVLPNARMSKKSYMEKHGIKTVRKEILREHASISSFEIPEYNNIIIETATMSREMWVRSTIFYMLAKALHGNGLIRLFAIYLYYEMGIGYDTFYDAVIDYFEENKGLFVSKLYSEIKQKAEDISVGKPHKPFVFEPCGDLYWAECEYMVLHVLSDIDLFFDEMSPFLRRFGIPDDVFVDLLAYQKAIIRKPGEKTREISLQYDVHSYIEGIYINKYQSLQKRDNKLVLMDTNPYDTWPDFSRFVVWYGKMGLGSYKDYVKEIDC